MKKKDTKQCCTITPLFPREAFVGLVSVKRKDETVFIYPFPKIYTDIKDFSEEIDQIEEEFSHPFMAVDEVGFIIPIAFEKKVPLKTAYWNSPSMNYSSDQRINLFYHVIRQYELFHMLVTPWRLSKKVQELSAAIPLYRSSEKERIEQFMMHSNYPVDEKGKFAALYSCGKAMGVKWKTGEFVNPHFSIVDISTH